MRTRNVESYKKTRNVQNYQSSRNYGKLSKERIKSIVCREEKIEQGQKRRVGKNSL